MPLSKSPLLAIVFAIGLVACVVGDPDAVYLEDEEVIAAEEMLLEGYRLVGDVAVPDGLILDEDEEVEGHFDFAEGDTEELLVQEPQEGSLQAARFAGAAKWPNQTLPIAFMFSISDDDREYFMEVCNRTIHKRSKLRCTYRNGETDYLYVQRIESCGWSYFGRIGGQQDLYVGVDCWNERGIPHELMHAAGLLHEQSRPDRGDHVKIRWSNIPEDKRYNFRKLDVKATTTYDTTSLMHYSGYAFSSNGEPTIVDLDNRPIPRNESMSDRDHRLLERLYGSN